MRSALEPGRASRNQRDFDELRGYREYHAACRDRFARKLPTEADAENRALEIDGFEFLDAMPREIAEHLLADLHERFQMVSLKKDRPELVGFAIGDPDFRDRLFESALSEVVDRRIAGYFGSEYRVYWYAVTRTEVAGGTPSFLWHCDRGPTRHLKLIVYLNDDAEHHGRTEFVDLEASRALDRIGYLFGPTRHRKDDLSELFARDGVSYPVSSRAMAPGQGVLFPPAVTAHRGVSPSRGPREVLTLCLLPSPLPWREMLDRDGLVDLRSDEKWHAHARELL